MSETKSESRPGYAERNPGERISLEEQSELEASLELKDDDLFIYFADKAPECLRRYYDRPALREEIAKQRADRRALGSDDGLAIYLRSIGHTKMMNSADEYRLNWVYQTGIRLSAHQDDPEPLWAEAGAHAQALSNEARRIFIEGNLRLVVSVAKAYPVGHLNLQDHIQAGNIGLMKFAVPKFDRRMGNKFSTYATRWIKKQIGSNIDDHGRSIRVPANTHDEIRSILLATDELAKLGITDPTPAQLAGYTRLNEQEVRDRLDTDFISRTAELDVPTGYNHGKEVRADKVADDSPSTEEVAIKAEEVAEAEVLLEAAMKHLSEREIAVLRSRFYYAADAKPPTYEEIGKAFGIGKNGAQRIGKRALAKLREAPELAGRL